MLGWMFPSSRAGGHLPLWQVPPLLWNVLIPGHNCPSYPSQIRLFTSAMRVIPGFQGALGQVIIGVSCFSPRGRCAQSCSSRMDVGMLTLMYGYSSVVTLELVCNDLGKSMVTDWSPLFNSTGKITKGPVDRSLQIFSWLICPLGLSAFSWGRKQICLSSGRGIWLAPSYNWIRTYGQSDPLEVRGR